MKRFLIAGAVVLFGMLQTTRLPSAIIIIEIMRRGDANNDAQVNIADATFISNYLFGGGNAPPCLDQADVNDDGQLNISDTSFLVNYLFGGGPEPPAPGPNNTSCKRDFTEPNLSCVSGDC